MPELQHTLDRVDGTTAVVTAGAGVVAFVVGCVVGSRLLRVLGLATTAAGGGLYVRAKLAERNEKTDAAESSIRSALDDLDPIAKAQILKDIVVEP